MNHFINHVISMIFPFYHILSPHAGFITSDGTFPPETSRPDARPPLRQRKYSDSTEVQWTSLSPEVPPRYPKIAGFLKHMDKYGKYMGDGSTPIDCYHILPAYLGE